MGNIIDSKFFISYNHFDRAIAVELQNILDRWKINCFIDVVINYDQNFKDRITTEMESTTHLFVIVTKNSQDSDWVKFEIDLAKKLNIKIIPLIVSLKHIPPLFDPFINYFKINGSINKIKFIDLLIEIGLFDDGFVSKNIMEDYPKKFPNEVFAEEVLKNNITIYKNDNRFKIQVNRNGVDHVLISNKGKKYFCDNFIKNLDEAKKLDLEIHNFQLGKSLKTNIIIPIDQFPLRWVSAGTLSIVEYKRKEWIPLFFRDIEPVGWNVALGGSERDFNKNTIDISDSLNEDLNHPVNVAIREFLEETLILNGSPGEGEVLKKMRFYWDDLISIGQQRKKSDDFSEAHIRLRTDNDDLEFFDDGNFSDVRNFNSYGIETDFDNTNTKLHITHEKDYLFPQRNILAAVNILELGIEIVKVIKYKIKKKFYYLDGEIIKKVEPENDELVRMPVALISVDFLKDKFKDLDISSIYTEGVQNAIDLNGVIDNKEVILFKWDIEQRVNISKRDDNNSEIERHKNWCKNFGKYFYDIDGQIIDTELPLIFTPSTVKLLMYYFANY